MRRAVWLLCSWMGAARAASPACTLGDGIGAGVKGTVYAGGEDDVLAGDGPDLWRVTCDAPPVATRVFHDADGALDRAALTDDGRSLIYPTSDAIVSVEVASGARRELARVAACPTQAVRFERGVILVDRPGCQDPRLAIDDWNGSPRVRVRRDVTSVVATPAGLFLSVATSGDEPSLYRSTDGTSWTVVPPSADGRPRSLGKSADGSLVAWGDWASDGPKLRTSRDGSTWDADAAHMDESVAAERGGQRYLATDDGLVRVEAGKLVRVFPAEQAGPVAGAAACTPDSDRLGRISVDGILESGIGMDSDAPWPSRRDVETLSRYELKPGLWLFATKGSGYENHRWGDATLRQASCASGLPEVTEFFSTNQSDFGHSAMTRDRTTLFFSSENGGVAALDLATRKVRAVSQDDAAPSDCSVRQLVERLEQHDRWLVFASGGACGYEGEWVEMTGMIQDPLGAATEISPWRAAGALAVDAAGTVYAAPASAFLDPAPDPALWRSADGGVTWTRVPWPSGNRGNIDQIVADATRPGYLLVVTQEGNGEGGRDSWGGWLFLSTDGGAHFTPMLDRPEDGKPAVEGVEVVGGAVDHVIVRYEGANSETVDGGATWRGARRPRPNIPPPGPVTAHGATLFPSDDGVLRGPTLARVVP